MTQPPIEIPQANPGAGYRALKTEIDAALARAMASGWYVLGEEVEQFEIEFANWLGAKYAVSCASGTDALALVLRGLGLGPGDTIATVSHTAVATVAAIEMAGAIPLLLDVQRANMTLDPAELDTVLRNPPVGSRPIRAVVAVHLYGQSADLDEIGDLCAKHRVALIEDCAQAHGAIHRGRRLGTIGVAGAFSLYPTKNLGAFGDGGIIATSDIKLASRIRSLRQYGWERRYISEDVGVNSRLDEVQAAILRVRLRHLDAQNARRQAIADAYDAGLVGTNLQCPMRRSRSEHVFHQYVVSLDDRERVQAALRAVGIGTAIHYPMPVHRQPAYADRVVLGPAGCRVTDELAPRILSLPIFPELPNAAIARVCAALRSALKPGPQ